MLRRMLLVGVVALAWGCTSSPTPRGGSARFEVAVTDTGFAPGMVTVPAGKPVTLVVTRKTDQTCAKEILFPTQQIRKELPLNQAVEIALPASPKGEIPYSCGMEMIRGKVVAQ